MKHKSPCPGFATAFALLATGHANLRAGDLPQRPGTPLSLQAAAKYLDERAEWWLAWSGAARGQATACLSCHTTLPYALARPVLGEQLKETSAGKVEERLIGVVKKRVENWDKITGKMPTDKNPFVPFYAGKRKPSAFGTESVLNTLVLVNHDVHRGKGLVGATTRRALEHLWQQQQDNGAWLWLHFGLNPWENDGAYYGAALAALAVGMAGKDYWERPEIQVRVAALKKYLHTQFSEQPLHHRVVALWASASLPGVLTDEVKKALIDEIQSVQQADGGWSLASLGKKGSAKTAWLAHGVYPDGVSDGYATGLIVLALKRARLPVDDPKLQRGIRWLQNRQKDGTWPATYPNRSRDPHSDVGRFMRDAATAFAILGLAEKR